MDTKQASDPAEIWRQAAFSGVDLGSFQPFAFYVAIPFRESVRKAINPETGLENWVIDGPLSDPGMDLEGEEMDMSGLKKGLSTFFNLKAPVDWDHLWEKTREPKWLIGQGMAVQDKPHPRTGNMVPWLTAELFRDKDVAGQAIQHLQVGGSLGYSVAGGVVKKSGTKIMEPIVTSVAVTPVPVVSANAGCISLIKSLQRMRDGEKGVELPVAPELLPYLYPFPIHELVKALATSGTLPKVGPGIEAGAIEDLNGAETEEERKRRLLASALGKALAGKLSLLRAATA